MNTLHLTLKKKWFDMIASGEKKEEYREIKPYWIRRFYAWGNMYDACRDFNLIQFKNGYSKSAPIVRCECKGIEIGKGRKDWGAPDVDVFIISLGDIVQQ